MFTLGPREPTLSENDLHLWHVDLSYYSPSSIETELLKKTLSPDEIQRMNQYHFEKDKIRFLMARGALRNILGRYLGILPGDIQFLYNDFGKPFTRSTLHFNVSHSNECIVVAISSCAPVGVDVENVNPKVDFLELAKDHFTNREYQTILDLPMEERMLAFYRAWTRKEAFMKAMGLGLSFSLSEVEVSLKPEDQAKIIKIQGSEEDTLGWSLFEWIPMAQHIAVTAIKEMVDTYHFWNWKID